MKNLHSSESSKNDSPRRKKIKLPPHSKLTKKIIRELNSLIEFSPPGRLSRNIRNIFLLYLSHEKDMLPNDIDDIIGDVYFLLEFLDTTEKELIVNS